MSDHQVPFHVPDIGAEEMSAVIKVLESGWLTTGPKVRQFEERFAAQVGAEYAVATNSCTAALIGQCNSGHLLQ